MPGTPKKILAKLLQAPASGASGNSGQEQRAADSGTNPSGQRPANPSNDDERKIAIQRDEEEFVRDFNLIKYHGDDGEDTHWMHEEAAVFDERYSSSKEMAALPQDSTCYGVLNGLQKKFPSFDSGLHDQKEIEALSSDNLLALMRGSVKLDGRENLLFQVMITEIARRMRVLIAHNHSSQRKDLTGQNLLRRSICTLYAQKKIIADLSQGKSVDELLGDKSLEVRSGWLKDLEGTVERSELSEIIKKTTDKKLFEGMKANEIDLFKSNLT